MGRCDYGEDCLVFNNLSYVKKGEVVVINRNGNVERTQFAHLNRRGDGPGSLVSFARLAREALLQKMKPFARDRIRREGAFFGCGGVDFDSVLADVLEEGGREG